MTVVNPKYIIENKILEVEDVQEQLQQNWIDLTINRIWKINTWWLNILTKTSREHCTRDELIFSWDLIQLKPWRYDILFWEKISLPNWISSFVVSRSTLNRWWNFITSWWYDAWFSWPMWWILHVTQSDLLIEKWVRIAQMIFFKSEKWDLYNWIYQNNNIA